MIINGVDLGKYMRIKSINRQLAPSVENLVFDVPGMHGAHHIRNIRKTRKIEVEFTIIGNSVLDRIEKAHIIAGYVTSEQDMTIILPDEPDKVYIGSLSGETDLDEILHIGQGTLTFFCSDPHILDTDVQSAQFDANGQLTIVNDGTAETYPSFSIAFNQSTTFFEIVNHTTEKRVRLGFPIEVEQTAIEREELVLHDTMASTSGWQQGSIIDNGVITGQMASDGQRFYVEDYGEGDPGKWYGPALKRSFTQLQDFRIEMYGRINNLIGQVGRLQLYLLDPNDRVVGMIGMQDANVSMPINYGMARIGAYGTGYPLLYQTAMTPSAWNNFNGIFRLERIGNRWTSYIARIDAQGQLSWMSTRHFTDVEAQFMQRVSQVQIHMGVFKPNSGPDYEPVELSASEIKVYRINEPQSLQEIPIIAHAGDVYDVNNGLNRVLRNGEPLNQIIALGNEFFALEKGSNRLEVFPKGIADITMSWRRRWV